MVLAGGKGPLTYVPSLDMLVQRMAKTSVEDVVGTVARALPSVHWESVREWNAESDLVVFDAVWPGDEAPSDRLLHVARSAGLSKVEVAHISPSDQWEVWVTLYRLTSVHKR